MSQKLRREANRPQSGASESTNTALGPFKQQFNHQVGSLFFKLAPELRTKIYRHLLVSNEPLEPSPQCSSASALGSGHGLSSELLSTCQAIYAEARPILYQENTVIAIVTVCEREQSLEVLNTKDSFPEDVTSIYGGKYKLSCKVSSYLARFPDVAIHWYLDNSYHYFRPMLVGLCHVLAGYCEGKNVTIDDPTIDYDDEVEDEDMLWVDATDALTLSLGLFRNCRSFKLGRHFPTFANFDEGETEEQVEAKLIAIATSSGMDYPVSVFAAAAHACLPPVPGTDTLYNRLFEKMQRKKLKKLARLQQRYNAALSTGQSSRLMQGGRKLEMFSRLQIAFAQLYSSQATHLREHRAQVGSALDKARNDLVNSGLLSGLKLDSDLEDIAPWVIKAEVSVMQLSSDATHFQAINERVKDTDKVFKAVYELLSARGITMTAPLWHSSEDEGTEDESEGEGEGQYQENSGESMDEDEP